MDYENLAGFSLHNLGNKNIILGKNGCGKSYLLKKVEQNLVNKPNVGKVRYISPERAGFLTYEPGIEQAIHNQPNWVNEHRRRNQSGNFKQQSVALYRILELLTLREIERNHILPDYKPMNFQTTIEQINSLLDRIEIERSSSGFNIIEKEGRNKISAEEISSGESELISLAIEFLSFIKECDQTKENFLLVDEPDVHLHPDLQDRLAVFISSVIKDTGLNVIIATHSTAFLGALSRDGSTRIAFMHRGNRVLDFKDVDETLKRVLPVFGAHPLSNIFNEAPILLIEGEDDERIWQQAVRTSLGKINIYPCVTDDINHLNGFEVEANNIIGSIYDEAKGYSIRDRDLNPEEIDNLDHIVRARLSCRTAENLLLSDDVLELAETNWSELSQAINSFVNESKNHTYHSRVKKFVDQGMDRKNADLKDIRIIIAGIIGSKPWEVLVGQAIASLKSGNSIKDGPDSLSSYLGEKICKDIIKI